MNKLTNMTIGQLATTIGTGIIAILPIVVPLIPPPYNIVVSAFITFVGSAWHLYQTPPTAK